MGILKKKIINNLLLVFAQSDGMQYNATYNGNQITIQTVNGPQAITYTLSGNTLSMLLNGVNYSFQKSGGGTQNNTYNQPQQNSYQPQQQQAGNLPGTIDQSIVGQWYYYSSSSGSYASSSTERKLEIFADGTYKYYYEGAVSGSNVGQDMYGGSASQNYDSGSWRLQGNTLHINSDNEGYYTYTLQKQNNHNNEPMLIINGDPFVTAVQKPPW